MSIDWLRWSQAGGTSLEAFASRQQVLLAAGVDATDSFERIAEAYAAPTLARLASFVARVESVPPFLYADLLSQLHSFALDPLSYCASDLLARDAESLTQDERQRLLDPARADAVLRSTKAGPRAAAQYLVAPLLNAGEQADATMREWSARVLEAAAELGIVRKIDYRRSLALALAFGVVAKALSGGVRPASAEDEDEESILEDEEEEEEEEEDGGEPVAEVKYDDGISVPVPAGLVRSNPAHASELSEALADKLVARYSADELADRVKSERAAEGVFMAYDRIKDRQPPRDYYLWNIRYGMDIRPAVRRAVCALIEAFFARSPYLVRGWTAIGGEQRTQLSEFVSAAKSVSAMLDMLEESKPEDYHGTDSEFSERYRRQVRKWTDSKEWGRERRVTRLFPQVSWALFQQLVSGKRSSDAMQSRSLHALLVRGKFKAIMRAGYDRQSLWNADINVHDLAYERTEQEREPRNAAKKKGTEEQRLAKQAPSIDAAARVLANRIREFSAQALDPATDPSLSLKGVWLCRAMAAALLRWLRTEFIDKGGGAPIVRFMREKAAASPDWTADETYRRMREFVKAEPPNVARLKQFNAAYDYAGLLLDLGYLGAEDIVQNYIDGEIFRDEQELTAPGDERRSELRVERIEKRGWKKSDGKEGPAPATYGISVVAADGGFMGATFAAERQEFVRVYRQQNSGATEEEAAELLKRVDRELLRAAAVRGISRDGRVELTFAERTRFAKAIDEIYRRQLDPEETARTLIEGAQMFSFSLQYDLYKKIPDAGGAGKNPQPAKLKRELAEALTSDWRRIAGVPEDEEEEEDDIVVADDYNEEEDGDFDEQAAAEEEPDEIEEEEEEEEEEQPASPTAMKWTGSSSKQGGSAGPRAKSMSRKAVIQRTGPELFNYSITERSPPWFVGGEEATFTDDVRALWTAAGFTPEPASTSWQVVRNLEYSPKRKKGRAYVSGQLSLAERNNADDFFDNELFAPNVIRFAGTVAETSKEQVEEALRVTALPGRAYYAGYGRATPLFLRHLFVLPVAMTTDY